MVTFHIVDLCKSIAEDEPPRLDPSYYDRVVSIRVDEDLCTVRGSCKILASLGVFFLTSLTHSLTYSLLNTHIHTYIHTESQ